MRVWIQSLWVLAVSAPAMAWADPVEDAHGEAASSAMPQLDPTYFASQLFWLLISGLLMFFLMTKVALPRVARMVDLRDEEVRKNLESAARLKLEAEDIKVAYLRALRDADERGRAMIDRTVNDMREKQTAALNEIHIRTHQQIVDTEQSLAKQTDALLSEVSDIAGKLSQTVIREFETKKAA